MPTQAIIRNVGGVEAADLVIGEGEIALVGGINGAGKTSLATACAAAFLGDPLLLGGMTKAKAGAIVRSGAATGSATVSTETGSTTISWPAATVISQGTAPHLSPIAAGSVSLLTMAEKDRTTAFTRIIRAEPEKADLERAINDANVGISQTVAAKCWEEIYHQGWDAAYAAAKETGAKLKGQWETATGERYGSAKANGWVPKGYTDGDSEPDASKAVDAAKLLLEVAVGNAAVSADEYRRMATLSRDLDRLISETEVARQKACTLADAAAAAQSALSAGPSAGVLDVPQHCPSCHAPLAVDGAGKIIPTFSVDRDDLAAAKVERARLTAISDDARHHLAEGEHRYRMLASQCDAAQLARSHLNKMPEPAEGAADAVKSARAAVAAAEIRLHAVRAKSAADKAAKSIAQNQAIVAALAPDGLRKSKLSKRLDAFNDAIISPLCDAAGWKRVKVEPDMTISYGGRVVLLSESEKFRVRVTLQVAVASVEKAPLVIIDAADILDKRGRNGLFRMLADSRISTLVLMTLNSRDLMPKLSAAGLGQGYWLEDGILTSAEDQHSEGVQS